ncbi:MAG: hypothetical protein V3V05_01050 [Pontiella sp.]
MRKLLCIALSFIASISFAQNRNFPVDQEILGYLESTDWRPTNIDAPNQWILNMGWEDAQSMEERIFVVNQAINELRTRIITSAGNLKLTVPLTAGTLTNSPMQWVNSELISASVMELENMQSWLKDYDGKAALPASHALGKRPSVMTCTLPLIGENGKMIPLCVKEGSTWKSNLTGEQLINFLLVSERLNHLQFRLNEPLRKKDISFATERRKAWENRLFNGYSQMPWELLANGWLTRARRGINLDAPPLQAVLLHPELSVGVPVKGVAASEQTPGWELDAHLAGIIWYPPNDRSWFIGLSGTLAYNNDLGQGWGPTIHSGGWSKSIPTVSIGYRWFDDDRQAIMIGVDLFNYLGKEEGLEQKMGMFLK